MVRQVGEPVEPHQPWFDGLINYSLTVPTGRFDKLSDRNGRASDIAVTEPAVTELVEVSK